MKGAVHRPLHWKVVKYSLEFGEMYLIMSYLFQHSQNQNNAQSRHVIFQNFLHNRPISRSGASKRDQDKCEVYSKLQMI